MRREHDTAAYRIRPALSHRLTHPGQPISRRADVIIRKQNHLPRCLGQSAVSSDYLSGQGFVGIAQGNPHGPTAPDHIGRAIGRAIVHHQQFRFQTVDKGNLPHSLQCFQQVRSTITGHDDDGYSHFPR